MQKRTLFSLTMLLCSGIAPVFAADLPKEVKAINQFREFRLDQGQIYELYVKTGDGVTTVTFPSAISKIAGVNVSVDGSSDFLISAKPGSYYFNIVALKKGATGTLTVIHNRQTYILYLKQNDKKAYAAVNFAATSGGSASVAGRGSAVSPARLLSLIDMTKGYHVLKQRYPSDLRDTIHAKNHRFFNFDKFRIELQEVVRFNREDTLVFKLLMHNDTSEEIAYDKFSFSVQAGNKTYYMSAADASGIMPPKSATWAFFSITGTPDGGRNNLAPDNNFLIGVTAKYMEEAYKIPQEITDPVAKRLIDLANRLEKKLAEMESSKKVNEEKKEVKDEKKNAVPKVSPSVKNPPPKVQKDPAKPKIVLAPPVVDQVKAKPQTLKTPPKVEQDSNQAKTQVTAKKDTVFSKSFVEKIPPAANKVTAEKTSTQVPPVSEKKSGEKKIVQKTAEKVVPLQKKPTTKKAEKPATPPAVKTVSPEKQSEKAAPLKTANKIVDKPKADQSPPKDTAAKTPAKDSVAVEIKVEPPLDDVPVELLESQTEPLDKVSETSVPSSEAKPEEDKADPKPASPVEKNQAEEKEVSFWDFSEFPDNLYCLVSWMVFWK